jgi:hypothetical protein
VKILDEVMQVPVEQLPSYIENRARKIVAETQGDSWDDPEEWQLEAVELAHAVTRAIDLAKDALHADRG